MWVAPRAGNGGKYFLRFVELFAAADRARPDSRFVTVRQAALRRISCDGRGLGISDRQALLRMRIAARQFRCWDDRRACFRAGLSVRPKNCFAEVKLRVATQRRPALR